MSAWARGFMQRALSDQNCKSAFESLRLEVVDEEIVQYVKSKDAQPQTREILLHILGPEFTNKYFTVEAQLTRQPEVIHPPYMLTEIKESLIHELESELIEHLNSKFSSWLQVSHFDNFKRNLQNLAENEVQLKIQTSARSKCDLIGELLANEIQGKYYSLPLVDNHDKFKSLDYLHPSENENPNYVEIMQHLFESGQGFVDSKGGQIRARKSLCALLKMSLGRSVPGSIRRLFYALNLASTERMKEIMRETERNIHTRAQPQKKDPNCSSVYNLLSRLVNETFRKRFVELDTPRRREYLLDVLNHHYVAYGEHKACILYQSMPLLMDFEHWKLPVPVFVCLLRNLSIEFLPGIAFKQNNCLTLAQSSLRLLEKRDKNLANSIRQLYEQHRINKERLDQKLNIISNDHVSIFLAWIEKGLSGVLRRETVNHIWSQIHIVKCIEKYNLPITLPGWSATKIMENSCVVIFQLLKDKIMQVESVSELERLLNEEPMKIYTKTFRDLLNKSLQES